MKHKHRITPGYMGGTYEDWNIAILSVHEHALAHKWLYMLFGNWQDKLAWEALSGWIGKEEIIRIKISKTHKGKIMSKESRKKMSKAKKDTIPWNKGKHHSEEAKKKNSESHKGKKHSEETKKKIGEAEKGKKNHFYGKRFSEEHKKKLSEAKKDHWKQGIYKNRKQQNVK